MVICSLTAIVRVDWITRVLEVIFVTCILINQFYCFGTILYYLFCITIEAVMDIIICLTYSLQTQ